MREADTELRSLHCSLYWRLTHSIVAAAFNIEPGKFYRAEMEGSLLVDVKEDYLTDIGDERGDFLPIQILDLDTGYCSEDCDGF